jgi:glycosyltransferase involved in cell wall biosynthesis
MRDRGHEIVVSGDRGEGHAMFESKEIAWIDIPLRKGVLGLWKSVAILREWLESHPVDVIHSHYRRATMLGRRVQRRGKPDQIPLLYTLHLSHMVMGYRRWFTDWGDHTHAASEDGKRWLVDDMNLPSERITVIPHGIDVDRFPVADEPTRRAAKAALGIDPDHLVASHVGRFDYPKNEEWLLDLAGSTRGQMPNLHILLVGGGPHEAALRDRVDAENLHDRVHIFGYRDPLPIYQATDLLLLPSIREGFAMACAEAMSVGVPVLRTRTSGTSETIVENVTGCSVPIDHDTFIDAAIRMLHDPAGLRRMGHAGAQHVREKLTFQRQVDHTIELYQRLSKHTGARGR